MSSGVEALAALRRYWGYESFRPKQERIVASLAGGHDACVIMPTGGGKSLCYQLPAVMQPNRTVIVISPLIALMQDQIAQLAQMGIPAGMVNSSIENAEQQRTTREAMEGRYRLLYLSPERLARPGTVAWLKRVPVSFFAIDEAHCISEWGHEFRPEYRQLSSLRQHFPERPIAAFTASATRRVRHDIINQLGLRDPHKYISSFHRSNLFYFVKECDAWMQPQLLVKALEKYAGSNVIVYAPTIKKVEETVDFLEQQGISALPYHGQMDPETRRRNQERWTSDEVPVLVGTLAFGLGINKAAVRAVIHLALPKSVEQYYQEAGRAGRDGLPSDCILLWQKRDVGLLTYFIEQITDPEEKQRSWHRYHEILRYVQSFECRHRQICLHFGETPKWESCGACDVCIALPDWLSAPMATARPKGKRNVTPPSTMPRAERPIVRPSFPDAEQELREYLRQWRISVAQKQGVPAFTIMHDTSLEELCLIKPESLEAIRDIHGFGERKTERYGREILNAIQQFRQGERARPSMEKKIPPREETQRLIEQGKSFEEIAEIRGRQMSTIVDLVSSMVENGEIEFQPAWIDNAKYAQIEAACALYGMQRLSPIKQSLPEEITYGEIKLVVAHLLRGQAESGIALIAEQPVQEFKE